MIQERWVEELKPNYKRPRVCLSSRKVEALARDFFFSEGAEGRRSLTKCGLIPLFKGA